MSDRVAYNDLYTLNENGTLREYTSSNNGYQTDVLADRMQSFIRSAETNDAQRVGHLRQATSGK